MLIKSVDINRFRGFRGSSFALGKHITLIAGQNGTQKSTLLGMITQPFSLNKQHPMKNEKPLSGGVFKSQFKEKFRMSPVYDNVKEHEWTLSFHLDDEDDFTAESIYRNKATNELRFWRKDDREAGSGYVQLPVIFLSLKRLLPIGEDLKLAMNDDTTLEADEQVFFSESYNKILISRDQVESLDYIESSDKQTLGVTTDTYDWNSNSAGQDNISKIILAVISFKRLKKKFPGEYRGRILAIDEFDATLYPASQVKLLEFLMKISSKLSLQVIATTHSLTALSAVEDIRKTPGRSDQASVIYLQRSDNEIKVQENPGYEKIKCDLELALQGQSSKRVPIFTEDREAQDFLKAVIKQRFGKLEYIDVALPCSTLMELARNKVPSFVHPNAIVVLDGDVRKDLAKKRLTNYLCLPGDLSPERMLAQHLSSLSDEDPFWKAKDAGYSKQFCFKDFPLNEIMSDRVKAKDWYKSQKEQKVWGRSAASAYNSLLRVMSADDKQKFLDNFESIYYQVFNS